MNTATCGSIFICPNDTISHIYVICRKRQFKDGVCDIWCIHMQCLGISKWSLLGHQVHWESLTLSGPELFVPYPFCCLYKCTETALNRILVRFLPKNECLEVFKGFQHEQEPVFSYKSGKFIWDRDTSLRVAAYTEPVIWLCAVLFMELYDEYRFWYVARNMIAVASQLGM